MIAEKPASLEFPLLAVCGITLGSVDRGEMHVSRPKHGHCFPVFCRAYAHCVSLDRSKAFLL